MLGSTVQFGGARGDDRFYIPVKARKNQNQRKQAQKTASEDSKSELVASESELVNSENKDTDDESFHSLCTAPSSLPSVDLDCNIERFLDSIAPLIPAQYLSKTTTKDWKTCDVEYQPYFALNDLWESFKEWSAYGAGVPLVVDDRQSVVQYYVPYLSAIQLYGGESAKKSSAKPRYTGEDSDFDYYRDLSSDGSNDSEFGKKTKFFPGQRRSQYRTSDVSFQMSRLSVHDDKHNTTQEGFSSDDSESGRTTNRDLLFEYFDQDPPFCREPLTDKILDLARRYPSLESLRSCDLYPASWMSVAWYPIYRIPTGPVLKDLEACFLTYHSLHTPSTENGGSQAPLLIPPGEMDGPDGVAKICLPTFAMASYKLKGRVWFPNGAGESPLSNSLLEAADNWLKRLRVNHPDYQFFVSSHGTSPRPR